MARVRQNQRTASFCCFLQKMISQENTVGVKKNRVACAEDGVRGGVHGCAESDI